MVRVKEQMKIEKGKKKFIPRMHMHINTYIHKYTNAKQHANVGINIPQSKTTGIRVT